jgi:acyl dehydratase
LGKSNVDEFIEDSNKLCGCEVEEWGQPGNPIATQRAFVEYNNVIGDHNPLFREPDYAYRTRYGSVIARPTFPAAIRNPMSQGAYANKDYGLANFLANVEFNLYDTIRVMDRFCTTLKTTNVCSKETHVFNQAEKKQIASVGAEGEYSNQYGALLAKTCSEVSMIPFNRGEEMFVDRELYVYTLEEAEKYGDDIDNEVQRGMDSLFWTDVNEGDVLTPVVKGPLELGPILGWPVATRTSDWHLENYYARAKEAPGEARVNPVTNWPYWVEQLEYGSYHTSKLRGISFPFAFGMHQACLADHLLTNWMSDDGFLRRLRMEISNVLMYGDINWYKGTVTEKYKEKIGNNVYGAVDIDIEVTNQLGEQVATGDATVYLSSPGQEVILPIPQK